VIKNNYFEKNGDGRDVSYRVIIASTNTFEDNVAMESEEGTWPEETKAIKAAAGISEAYRDIIPVK
jgi:hypothetical protein